MSLNPVRHDFPKDGFSVEYRECSKGKKICMYSNNIEFLKETWEGFSEYTKKVDPGKKIGLYKIKTREKEGRSLEYYVKLHRVLPRLVIAQSGESFVNHKAMGQL